MFDARPAKLEWLFSKLSLDHTSASASTAPTGATSTGAATITTVSGDNNSNSSCSSSGSETAAHRHRVFLGPKLACRAEGWEEGAPEDLLPVVRECVRLAGAVMQAMSSRVRGKSQASVAALRSAVPRILVLLLQVTGGSVHSSIQRGISLCATAEREVAQNLRTTLLGAAEALMSSGIFGSAEEIADALATLSTADEKLLGHLLRGIGNAVDCAVLTSLLDSLLVSKVRCTLILDLFFSRTTQFPKLNLCLLFATSFCAFLG